MLYRMSTGTAQSAKSAVPSSKVTTTESTSGTEAQASRSRERSSVVARRSSASRALESGGVVRVGRGSGRGREGPAPTASPAIGGAVRRWEREVRTLSRSAPGFVVLLGPDDNDPIVLRGTGLALWAALDGPETT